MQQQQTISQSNCEMQWKVDFMWQPKMTSSVDGLRRNSKGLPKAKLAPRKVTVTVWWSAACLIHYSSLNSMKPLHLRSMLSKSMRCTENSNACSLHWSTEWAQFFMTMPNRTLHNERFQSWMSWAMKFCLTHHVHLTSHQLTTTFKHLNNFLQGKCFHNQQEEENAFQEFTES